MTFRTAVRCMGKSKDFLTKWVNWYNETMNVGSLLDRAKTHVTAKKEYKIIIKLFEKHSTYNLQQAQTFICFFEGFYYLIWIFFSCSVVPPVCGHSIFFSTSLWTLNFISNYFVNHDSYKLAWCFNGNNHFIIDHFFLF